MKSVMFMPVFNQIEDFPAVLEDLAGVELPCHTLLIVNNGSTDGSAELIRNSGYPFLDVAENRGIGYSYRLALQWALERDYEVFGTIAGNGKMLAGEMHRILDPLASGEADYVSGSRFLPGGESPNLRLFRRVSIPLVNGFVWVLTGVRLTDATCGYRAFRMDLISRAEFDWEAEWLQTYGLEYYLYAKALLDPDLRCLEVPVTMRYPPRGRSYSKIPPVVGWWEMLKPWMVARFDGKGLRRKG